MIHEYTVPLTPTDVFFQTSSQFESIATSLTAKWRHRIMYQYNEAKRIAEKANPSDEELARKEELDDQMYQTFQVAIKDSYK